MNNLLVKFNEMPLCDWDYYFGSPIDNPFYTTGEERFDVFIKNYFGKSGKREMVNEFKKIAIFSPSRAIHTVSVFFLGIHIWKNTKLHPIFLDDTTNIRGNPTFQFIWFLSILFHDFAESIEEDVNCDDLNDLFKKYEIEHRLTDYNEVEHIDKTLFGLIKKYFYYRRYSMKSIDHGILAGIYMYDRLIKIRRQKVSDGKAENDNGLNWHESLEPLYATAAAAIACHNIWTTKKRSKEHSDYIKFELDALVRPTFKRIKIESNALLFLFGLVDTIDPIKYFMKEGFAPESILKSLDIESSDDSITIINKEFTPEIFKQYRDDNARNFEGWLDLIVGMIEGERFRIRFN